MKRKTLKANVKYHPRSALRVRILAPVDSAGPAERLAPMSNLDVDPTRRPTRRHHNTLGRYGDRCHSNRPTDLMYNSKKIDLCRQRPSRLRNHCHRDSGHREVGIDRFRTILGFTLFYTASRVLTWISLVPSYHFDCLMRCYFTWSWNDFTGCVKLKCGWLFGQLPSSPFLTSHK